MKLRILTKKLFGHKIATPIYMTNGMVLLNSGSTLTEKMILRLQDLGVSTVYVEDRTCAIELQEMINTKVKINLIRDTKLLFDGIRKNNKLDKELAEKIVDTAVENLNLSENAFLYNNISFENNGELRLVLHSLEVLFYSLLVGAAMKYNISKLTNLGIGSLLHDIGLIFTEGEEHTQLGYNFVKTHSNIPATSYVCLQQHHEYEDGSGYPQKLLGEKIYELSKVVGICDEYVTMLHGEVVLSPSEIIETMTAKAVLKYDHEIYRKFAKAIYCYPNGMEVRLSNNKVGIVVRQNKDLPTRPIIVVFENGEPKALDLTDQKYQTLFIEEVILQA